MFKLSFLPKGLVFFFVLLLAWYAFLGIIVPQQVVAQNVPDNTKERSGFVIEASWVNRATLEIKSIRITDRQLVNEEFKDESLESINEKLARYATGEYKSPDIAMDSGEEKFSFYKEDKGQCKDNEKNQINSLANNGPIQASEEVYFNNENLWIPRDASGCKNVLAEKGFTLARNIMFTPSAGDNRFIWFEQSATNPTSLTRVDGTVTFNKSPDNPLIFRGDSVGDCLPRTEFVNSPIEGINDGFYETCVGGDSIVSPARILVVNQSGIEQPVTGAIGEGFGGDSCEANNNAVLAWLMCGILDVVDSAVMGLNDAAIRLLDIDQGYFSDEGLRTVWSYFRNLASFLLIIIGLIMIIGQAVSKD